MTDNTVTIRRYSRSEFSTFRRCRRKWWFQHYLGLKSKERKVDTASVGTLVHKMLQEYYQDTLELDQYTLSKQEIDDPIMQDEMHLACIMMEGYIEWLEDTGADAKYDVEGVESQLDVKVELRRGPLSFPLPPSIIGGTLDLVLWDKQKKVPIIMDHKTVMSFKQTVDLLPINPQFQFYAMLYNICGELYNWTPIHDVEVNMLRRVKRSARAKPPFYDRVRTYYNQAQLDSTIQKTLGQIIEFLYVENKLSEDLSDNASVIIPNPTTDCSWDCAYVTACKMVDDGSRVMDYIEETYDKVDSKHLTLTEEEYEQLPTLIGKVK